MTVNTKKDNSTQFQIHKTVVQLRYVKVEEDYNSNTITEKQELQVVEHPVTETEKEVKQAVPLHISSQQANGQIQFQLHLMTPLSL